MRLLFTAFVFFTSLVSAAHASTVSFSDSVFDDTSGANPGDNQASLIVDGVSFLFTAVSRGSDGFRRDGPDTGLQFGVGGNGMISITAVADQDILLTSISGRDNSVDRTTSITPPLPFDVLAGSFTILDQATFAETTGSLALGNYLLTAGTSFTITDGANGNALQRFILSSFDFEAATTAPIPLPAGLPLLLAGLGGLAVMKRRKER